MKLKVLTLTSEQSPHEQGKLIQEMLDKGWRIQSQLQTEAYSGGMKQNVKTSQLVFRPVRRFWRLEW